MAIFFYTRWVKLLAIFSFEKATYKAFELFCTPYNKKYTVAMLPPAIFNKAKSINLLYKNVTLQGWQWLATENSNGKNVLIAHGYDSCSYKFEKYVEALLNKGFSVIAFDAKAHGQSQGKTLNAIEYAEMMLMINEQIGVLYGIISHSLGSLASSFAAQQLPQLQKLVLIAPATETLTAINHYFKYVPFGEDIKQNMIRSVELNTNKKINQLSVNYNVKTLTVATLWVHDEQDIICPFADIQPTLQAQPSNIQFLITNGLGHNRIYKTPSTLNAVINFMQ